MFAVRASGVPKVVHAEFGVTRRRRRRLATGLSLRHRTAGALWAAPTGGIVPAGAHKHIGPPGVPNAPDDFPEGS